MFVWAGIELVFVKADIFHSFLSKVVLLSIMIPKQNPFVFEAGDCLAYENTNGFSLSKLFRLYEMFVCLLLIKMNFQSTIRNLVLILFGSLPTSVFSMSRYL